MLYLLSYDVVADYAERRKAFRAAHLEHARRARNPIDDAVLLFRGSFPAVAEAFNVADPYVTNGLVTGWRVREWTTGMGADALKRAG